jgi:hypothetical protein
LNAPSKGRPRHRLARRSSARQVLGAVVAGRATWPLVVVATVVLVNLPALVGLVDVSPLGPVGVTASHVGAGVLPGQWTIDPNIGYTAQALGHLAALDWLHGTVPWWNPLEGLGTPLAAGMQSAAFFPPTLLLALPQGQLLFHMVLESTAGLSTWFLLREIGLGPRVAALGGILFALNGTLAWFGSAGANPVALLPLMLLGIERLARREGPDPAGWMILAGGLALSINAGFPEIAYVDGLFVLVWFVFRLAGHPAGGRRRFAGRVVLGAGVGTLLAAPLLVAFVSYLPTADVGVHAGSLINTHLGSWSAPVVGLPYLYGPLITFSGSDPSGHLSVFFGQGGGYLTATTIALAIVGLAVGRHQRGLRLVLAVTAGLLLLWAFGVPPFQYVLARVVPLTSTVNISKYCDSDIELAFVVLACFGVDAVARRKDRAARLAVVLAGVATLAWLGAVLAFAWPEVRTLYDARAAYRVYPVLMICWAAVLVVGVTVAGAFTGRRISAGVVATLLALDGAMMFGFPQLSAPRSVTIDMGPVEYLASHLGNGRYFSLGTYKPNYGSYFGIASLDVDDLPVPKLFEQYVSNELAPNAIPTVFDGRSTRDKHGPTEAQELVQNLAAFEALDVRYVVVPTGNSIFGAGPTFADGVSRVYMDGFATIYSLPDATSFFSVSGAACGLQPAGWAEVTATCASPTTLVRSELDLPGWTADINGRPVQIESIAHGLESVQLPAGTSRVTFSYTPVHLDIGLGLFALGAVTAVGVPLWGRRRQRGQKHLAEVSGSD